MKKRVAKARISPEMWTRLNNGETIRVRIPADVCELRVSLREGDENALFDGIFGGIWRNLLRRLEKSISGNP